MTVRFRGADKRTFADGRARERRPGRRYFAAQLRAPALVNWDAVEATSTSTTSTPSFCGEDLLVVTTPALQPAANTFANARQAAGYATKVAAGRRRPGQIGTTRAPIQAYILGELNAACTARVPATSSCSATRRTCPPGTSRARTAATWPSATSRPTCRTRSTFPSDLFADVQLGRIPAHDLDAANAVVNKIVGYETTPPAPPATTSTTTRTVTAYFEREVRLHPERGPVRRAELQVRERPDYRALRARRRQRARTRAGSRGRPRRSRTRWRTTGSPPTASTRRSTRARPESYYNGDPIPDYLRKPTFAVERHRRGPARPLQRRT